MAIVGESGSGKTSLALAVARLLPPGGEIAGGAVRVDGVDVTALTGAELRRARGRLVGYLAQDSMAALNPVLPAGLQVAEVFETRDGVKRGEARRQAAELLAQVGIQRAGEVARHVPARALRRHAPAGDDRDGARSALAAPHRRRADDRARRDRAGRDPGAGSGAPGRARRHVPVDHPRHGRRRRDRRHRRRHVRRQDRRAGAGRTRCSRARRTPTRRRSSRPCAAGPRRRPRRRSRRSPALRRRASSRRAARSTPAARTSTSRAPTSCP